MQVRDRSAAGIADRAKISADFDTLSQPYRDRTLPQVCEQCPASLIETDDHIVAPVFRVVTDTERIVDNIVPDPLDHTARWGCNRRAPGCRSVCIAATRLAGPIRLLKIQRVTPWPDMAEQPVETLRNFCGNTDRHHQKWSLSA